MSNTLTLAERLGQRPAARDRLLRSMHVTSGGAAPLEAFEQRGGRAGRQQRTAAEAAAPQLFERAGGDGSLVAAAARAVALGLHRGAEGGVAQLPFHLKEAVLGAAATLAAAGDARRLAARALLGLVDRDLRVLCVAHSDCDLPTLKRFLPPTQQFLLATTRDHVPDSWDSDSEDADSNSCDSDLDNDAWAITKLHTLDISFTRINPPSKLYKLISTHLPNLFKLSIAGCFDAETGPSFFHQIAHSLLNLTTLDVSWNPWIDRDVIELLPWESVLGRLQVFIARGTSCESSWLVTHLRRRRPAVHLISR